MARLAGKASKAGSLSDRVPPHLFFIGSAVFHYLGPSFAVLLFARVPVGGVAWLRILSAGLIFAIWRRPWRMFREAERSAQLLIVGLGVVFAAMNYSFYTAIDRLPLGTVAAIEFMGPILLALIGTSTSRNLIAVVVAATGVYLLTDVRIGGGSNRVRLGLYQCGSIHSVRDSRPPCLPCRPFNEPNRPARSRHVGRIPGDNPPRIREGISRTRRPDRPCGRACSRHQLICDPLLFDQLAMRRRPKATYALFVAMLPATAMMIGAIVRHQIPVAAESLAATLVILGMLIHQESDASHT